MDRYLKVGDYFKSKKIGEKAVGQAISKSEYKFDEIPNEPFVSFSVLSLSDYPFKTLIHYKIVKDGWYKKSNIELNTTASHLELEDQIFFSKKSIFLRWK